MALNFRPINFISTVSYETDGLLSLPATWDKLADLFQLPLTLGVTRALLAPVNHTSTPPMVSTIRQRLSVKASKVIEIKTLRDRFLTTQTVDGLFWRPGNKLKTTPPKLCYWFF